MRTRSILWLVAALVATSAGALELQQVSVPMRDGVVLAADLYLPDSARPLPAVLIRTPYGKAGMKPVAERFVAHDYAVLVEDVRGKYASGGEFTPFVNETRDGLDTLDWMAASPWSNGRVAAWGSSYLAMCGLLLAREGHPALRAVFAISGWTEGAAINLSGGAMHIGLAIPWLLFEGGRTQRSLKHFDIDELFLHKPLRSVFALAGVEMPAWNDPSVLHTGEDEAMVMRVPVFHMTGWYDFVSPASIAIWRGARARSDAPQKLLIGPWIHDQFWDKDRFVGEVDTGPDAVLGVDGVVALALDFFAVHLRDETRPDPPAVKVFFFGENRWRTFPSWPPPRTIPMRFYLSSSRQLVRRAPRAAGGRDSFVFDPDRPVSTTGGANFHFFPNAGVRDQREIERRADVVSFTTSPLEHELILAGPVRAVLSVSTEGRDTDFTAKLVDVTPEGKAMNIVDGILRLSMRRGASEKDSIEPGRVVEAVIDLGEIAITLPRGHRLRLDVSSSNFPKFDRNPNTGEDPLDATAFRTVRQTIHRSRSHPSYVELTILQGDVR